MTPSSTMRNPAPPILLLYLARGEERETPEERQCRLMNCLPAHHRYHQDPYHHHHPIIIMLHYLSAAIMIMVYLANAWGGGVKIFIHTWGRSAFYCLVYFQFCGEGKESKIGKGGGRGETRRIIKLFTRGQAGGTPR